MLTPRLAYILLWFPEPTQTFILDEVNTLRELGADLRVFTLYGPRPPERLRGLKPPLAPVEHLGLAAGGKIARSLQRLHLSRNVAGRGFLRRVLIRPWRNLETAGEALWAALCGVWLAERFQALGIRHIHAPWANGPATAAWVASALSGIPFSFCGHAHDIYPPDGALAEKLRAAAFVRTISRANQRHLTALAPEAKEKIVRIPYGAPLKGNPRPWRPGSPPYRLLAIGRLVEKKGFSVLLQACRHLLDGEVEVHLTLAGDGPERSRLLSLCRALGLEDRVCFLGHVPHNEIPRLFHSHDLFVMPCLVARGGDRDGLPNVILEALAHEVPVVATDINGIREAIVPGETGWLVPQAEPQLLAQAIREALADPGEARRRARAGRHLVQREFDSRTNYARLKEWLEKCSLPGEARDSAP